MTPKKPPTPTTPQDQLLALMTSGQITPQQYIRINEIDSQRHSETERTKRESEKTKRKGLIESTKKAGISTVRKIITYDDSSDEDDKENSKKNNVEKGKRKGDDDDDDKKPAAKPAAAPNKRRRIGELFGATAPASATGGLFGPTAVAAPSAGGHFGSVPAPAAFGAAAAAPSAGAPAPAARNRVLSYEQDGVDVMKIEKGGKVIKSNCVVAVDSHEVLHVYDAPEDVMNNNWKEYYVLNNGESFKFKKPENGLGQLEMKGRFDSAVETFTLTMDLNNYEKLKMLWPYNIN